MIWELPTLPIREIRGIITLGNLHLNLDTYELRIGTDYVSLSVREFDLIYTLANEHDRIVPTDQICRTLWGGDGLSYSRRLAVLVHRLRYKLDGSYPYRIHSIRSRGYGLLPDHGRASGPPNTRDEA